VVAQADWTTVGRKATMLPVNWPDTLVALSCHENEPPIFSGQGPVAHRPVGVGVGVGVWASAPGGPGIHREAAIRNTTTRQTA
jgi:hypothetical protein